MTAAAVLVVICCGCAAEVGGEQPTSKTWQEIEPGLELGVFSARQAKGLGDGRINVLRIDPRQFELRLLNASAPGQGRALTVTEWCKRNGLTAAINASMYQEDYRTSVSLMRSAEHVNNSHVTRDRAILAFDARSPEEDPVRIIDLECETLGDWKDRYGTFVQSIRMLSCKGKNVWSPQPKKWSTAAIGIDRQGRVLFIHVRTPFTTHDLIDTLIALPIDLASLMYSEGGPEAQLHINGPERAYEFIGSYETSFNENDDNAYAWPVPNVVGIVGRPDTGDETR